MCRRVGAFSDELVRQHIGHPPPINQPTLCWPRVSLRARSSTTHTWIHKRRKYARTPIQTGRQTDRQTDRQSMHMIHCARDAQIDVCKDIHRHTDNLGLESVTRHQISRHERPIVQHRKVKEAVPDQPRNQNQARFLLSLACYRDCYYIHTHTNIACQS